MSLPPVFGPAAPTPLPDLAVVRIDADAYDGVRDALESLYPRLSPGGVVIIDDLHLVAAAAAVHEFRRANRIFEPIFLVPSDYVYTCSVGGRRVVDTEPTSLAGAVGGPAGASSCDNPRWSTFLHNKHLIAKIPPHVAYWTKGH